MTRYPIGSRCPLTLVALALAALIALGSAASANVRLGQFGGRWDAHDATFRLSRKANGVYLGLVEIPGRHAARWEIEARERPNGQLAIVVRRANAQPRRVLTSIPFVQRLGKTTYAIYRSPTVEGQPARVELRIPVRGTVSCVPRRGIYSGEWHQYRALYQLSTRTAGGGLKGWLVLLSGPFSGQVTPVTVVPSPDGTLAIERDVGSGRLFQRVRSAPPRRYRFGRGGMLIFDGPMTGYNGVGHGRIRVPTNACRHVGVRSSDR
ncbi:MAG: hypothetical protein KC609_24910 [Myxococcales bacterium]|nr:hypothetical protein [Myxococcales bacterium]